MEDPGMLCAYASIILHSDNIAITEENILKVLNAADCKIQPIWANLFAKVLPKMDIESMLTNVGGGGAAAVGATATETKEEAPEEEEAKPESESESEDESGDDMGLDLFD